MFEGTLILECEGGSMWKSLRWVDMVGIGDKFQKQSLAIVYCRHSRFA